MHWLHRPLGDVSASQHDRETENVAATRWRALGARVFGDSLVRQPTALLSSVPDQGCHMGTEARKRPCRKGEQPNAKPRQGQCR